MSNRRETVVTDAPRSFQPRALVGKHLHLFLLLSIVKGRLFRKEDQRAFSQRSVLLKTHDVTSHRISPMFRLLRRCDSVRLKRRARVLSKVRTLWLADHLLFDERGHHLSHRLYRRRCQEGRHGSAYLMRPQMSRQSSGWFPHGRYFQARSAQQSLTTDFEIANRS